MDAKLMSQTFPELGSEEDLASILKKLESIPKIDLYKKRVVCLPSSYGSDPDKGHVLIESVSADNVVEDPVAALELDAESCEALLKALLIMQKMFAAMAGFRAGQTN